LNASTTTRACAALLLVMAAGGPDAAEYPAKPIRLVVPFAPGGGADILGRMVAQKLTEATGQTIVVDNRPGASGMIGIGLVASAPPDGYTIVIVPAEFTINPSLYRKVPYDPVADFVPITQATSYSGVLVVHPSLPVKSVKELIALAKARPGQLAYATSGVGGAPHMSAEVFQSMAGVKMIHVPYKGTGQALGDLLGGQTQLMFASPLPITPHVRAGRLRALAVASRTRSPSLPELPTIHEAGLPGFETAGWFGFLAPAGTPPRIVEVLYERIAAALGQTDVRERLLAQGNTTVGSKPDEFARHIAQELVKWRKVVQDSGARAE
jgi:tripartite-type tricarboxylate transporter receptor subunit TctC